MTDDEYRDFLTVLFDRYVRPRLARVRRRFHHHMMEEWRYHLDQAIQAASIVRFIETHCENDTDIYRTFTIERLKQAVSDTKSGLDFGTRVAEEAGYLDAFEAFAKEILTGLAPQHLPDADLEVLRDMGSANPSAELHCLVLLAKQYRERLGRHANELAVHQQLDQAEKRVSQGVEDFEASRTRQDESSQPPVVKTRRWFKGLGQIAQGAALTIADIALAAGGLDLPVSPETRTWGSIASVSTGVGAILGGAGDLRNE